MLDRTRLGESGEDQHSARADTMRGHHVVVGRVADDDHATPLPRPTQYLLEEEGLRLPDADRGLAGGDLDRGDDRSRTGEKASLDGIGAVAIRTDESRAGEHAALRLGDLRVRHVEIEAHDDGVRRWREVDARQIAAHRARIDAVGRGRIWRP